MQTHGNGPAGAVAPAAGKDLTDRGPAPGFLSVLNPSSPTVPPAWWPLEGPLPPDADAPLAEDGPPGTDGAIVRGAGAGRPDGAAGDDAHAAAEAGSDPASVPEIEFDAGHLSPQSLSFLSTPTTTPAQAAGPGAGAWHAFLAAGPAPAASENAVSITGSADFRQLGLDRDVDLASNPGGDLVGLDDLRADGRFAGIDGEGYGVVVIDTGIDLDHRAFGSDADGDGISDRIVHAADFTGEGDGTADDVNGHGTHVASIVGSESDAYLGAAPASDIIALQGLRNSGSGSSRGIEDALRWVIDNAATYNIVSVNLSLGDGSNVNTIGTDFIYGDEFQALADLGVVVVAAAGNSYGRYQAEGASRMAADPNAIAVGAVWDGDHGRVRWGESTDRSTAADRITSFSQRSDDLDMVFAPGALIEGALPGGTSGFLGGTSMAAPFVAGIAALAQDIADTYLGRRLTTDEFHALLLDTAVTINDGDDEDDDVANTGIDVPRVDAHALAEAIHALAGPAPDPDPDPDPAPDPDPEPDPAPGPDGDIRDDWRTQAIFDFAPVASTIDFAGDRDWWRVLLEAGETYAFTLAGDGLSDPVLALRDATGAALAVNDDAGGSLDSRIVYEAGETEVLYLSAEGFGGATGRYVLDGGIFAPPPDDYPADTDTPSTLSAGTDTTGSIEVAGDVDWHRLEVAARTTYTIDIAGAGGRALADPALAVVAADGRVIASDSDGGPGRDASISFTASERQTLYVAASGEDEETGDYVISLAAEATADDLPDDDTTPATVDHGRRHEGTIDFDGDRDWVAIDMNVGRSYRLDLSGHRVDGAGLQDPHLRLYDAAGTLVLSDDDGGRGLDARVRVFQPEESGTYYLEAASFADVGTGGWRMAASIHGGRQEPTADAETDSSLEIGRNLRSRIDQGGDVDWHRVAFEEGRSYTIEMKSSNGSGGRLRDPVLEVLDADGNRLARDDDGGRGLNAELLFTAPEAGEYFVAAMAGSDRMRGNYTIRVEEEPGAASDDAGDGPGDATPFAVGSRDRFQIERPGDTDWFAVDLAAGSAYRVIVNGAGYDRLDDPMVRLRDADGASVAFDDDGGRGLNARLGPLVVSEGGRYYVEVSGFGEDTGDYVMFLREMPARPRYDVLSDVATRAVAPGEDPFGKAASGLIDDALLDREAPRALVRAEETSEAAPGPVAPAVEAPLPDPVALDLDRPEDGDLPFV